MRTKSVKAASISFGWIKAAAMEFFWLKNFSICDLFCRIKEIYKSMSHILNAIKYRNIYGNHVETSRSICVCFYCRVDLLCTAVSSTYETVDHKNIITTLLTNSQREKSSFLGEAMLNICHY